MKLNSAIIVGALAPLLTATIEAQSTFHFQNLVPSSGIDAPVFDADGARLTDPHYAVELWGGARSDSLSPTLDFSSGQRLILPFLSGVGAGYFTSVNQMTVWAVAGGDFAWVQVRAWDVRLGATYEEVVAIGVGGYGESSLLYKLGGNPLGLPTPPSPLTGLQAFSLLPVVPEPSTWPLFALGGTALYWAWRWRSQRRS
ncbi:MAG: PEP-CTERM sorting domain-containing protein [Verrucomicrobia bacterium]|nr:PEP-CTERM sorting domain-containing protein [Verrucomicrobiota bacterium]